MKQKLKITTKGHSKMTKLKKISIFAMIPARIGSQRLKYRNLSIKRVKIFSQHQIFHLQKIITDFRFLIQNLFIEI